MGIQVFSKRACRNKVLSKVSTRPPSSETNVQIEIEELPSTINTFQELGIEEWVVTQLRNMEILKPTVVQIKSIPQMLHRKDVVVSAKTGDGKTLSYTIPILQELFKDPYGIFALVLVPVRELAFQITDQFNAIGSTSRVRTAIITGGKDIVSNHDALKKRPHIVVATPGRLIDIISYNQDLIKYFLKLRFLVLDEADRLIEPSYEKDLTYLFKLFIQNGINAQKLIFSATLTDELLSLCKNDKETSEKTTLRFNGYLSLKNPYMYHSEQYQIPSQLVQEGILIPSHIKIGYLFYILTELYSDLRSIIVFVGKYFTCEMLYITGKQLKLPIVRLHSKMKQRSRLESLTQFKNEKGKILITTDVASRGLDIPFVQLVINYDLPHKPLEYIHRVGRTARANKLGKSLSFVTESDLKRLEAIQDLISLELPFITIEEAPILKTLPNLLKKKRIAIMEMHDNGIDIKDEM